MYANRRNKFVSNSYASLPATAAQSESKNGMSEKKTEQLTADLANQHLKFNFNEFYINKEVIKSAQQQNRCNLYGKLSQHRYDARKRSRFNWQLNEFEIQYH